MGSNIDDGMHGVEFIVIIANSPLGGSSLSWWLSSNNFNPFGRLENPTNIIDVLDF
jgi:hypothetical protein